MKACAALLFTTLLIPSVATTSCPAQLNQGPLTVAEASNYTATSRYADIVQFITALQGLSDKVRVETICTSAEGREVPLLIIGNPPPASPNDMNYGDRTVMYIQANIHAGEVEGKEAALMLARDLLLKKESPSFDNLVVLIAPIFNADGNEKISTDNRRNQVGPEKGVGIRYNGQNLDLNRDGMKLESPEVAGLVENVLNRWDPVLILDSHTHNGSYHQEPVTWVWQLNPNGNGELIDYMCDTFMPAVSGILKEKYDVPSIPHGDYMSRSNPEAGWRPLGPQPRYLSNYIGLRNRLAILNENYPYAEYKTRVLGCYHFFLSLVEYCNAHTKEIRQLIGEADRKTIARGLRASAEDSFAVEYDVRPLEKKYTVLGYEMEEVPSQSGGRTRYRVTDREKTYQIPYYADYFPKRSVRFPRAYFLSVFDAHIIKKLQQHGILVERLLEPVTVEAEEFRINELTSAQRLNQGHRTNSVTGEYVTMEKEFPAGTLYISTAQALANVAAYLLEPESDDGLLYWNFFDRYIASQWGRGFQAYPVYKVYAAHACARESL